MRERVNEERKSKRDKVKESMYVRMRERERKRVSENA